MAIAIDKNLIEDVNDPSFDVINYCIKKHEQELPRLQMLFDYYRGLPHKLGSVPDAKLNDPHELDEIYVNNAKYVTDMMTGFTVGNPISYTADNDKNIDDVIAAMDVMRIAKHDKELEKDLSTMGIGYELHYLSVVPGTEENQAPETEPKVASIDPRGMILVVDDTVDRNYLFAIRPYEKEDLEGNKIYEYTIYTAVGIITYKSKVKGLVDGQLSEEPTYVNHFYGMVPVVEFRNNEEKQGDYEQQLSQIDAYNLLQTERIKDKKNFVKAMMILYGFSLPEEKPRETPSGQKIIEAPAKEDGANVEFATNTLDETQTQVLADSLLDDFHKSAYVPNLNDKDFAGNISGEAMKYKLLGLLLALSVKTGYFEDGIIRRLKLLENIVNVSKHANNDTSGAEIKFKVNLPFNRKDVIDQIRDSQDFVPLLISLGWLDDVDDPQQLLDMLHDQQDDNMQRQEKLFGIQAKDSHSDLEVDEGNSNEDDDSSQPATLEGEDENSKKKGAKK